MFGNAFREGLWLVVRYGRDRPEDPEGTFWAEPMCDKYYLLDSREPFLEDERERFGEGGPTGEGANEPLPSG